MDNWNNYCYSISYLPCSDVKMVIGKNLFRSWVWILLEVDEKSSKIKIAKKSNITTSHTITIIEGMIKDGLLEIRKNNKQKRDHIILLTDRGRKMKEHLVEVKRLLENKDGYK